MHNNSDFIEYFKSFDTFTTADITSYFRKKEPELKQTTINWRVYALVNDQIISRVSKGIFSVTGVKRYIPQLDKSLLQTAKKIGKQFPFIDFCIWDTSVINSLAQHLSNETFFIVEVEKDAVESVFHFLQEKTNKVYYNPTQDIVDNYLFLHTGKPYIVKNLITESPIIEENGIKVSSLEKILVDVYCDKTLFGQYQGNEMKTLYRYCFEYYSVNTTRLLRYASRRGKMSEIELFVNQIICNNL
ncbi:MAG: hypothetical protein IJP80_04955 [Bacteroidales bacterium]|nr:hypothetical protein [Bacteroidales bacterium]